jgi:RHS repeat-associated protein
VADINSYDRRTAANRNEHRQHVVAFSRFAAACVLLFITLHTHAQCTLSGGSAIYDPATASVTFSGTVAAAGNCATRGVGMIDDLRVIGVECFSNPCTASFTERVECWTPGSHTVRLNGNCTCEASAPQILSFTVPETKVDVHASALATATPGVFDLKFDWQFQNVAPTPTDARGINYYILQPDGTVLNNSVHAIRVESQSGTVHDGLDTECWQPGNWNIRALMGACDRTWESLAPLKVSFDPNVALDVSRDADGVYWASVKYSFQNVHSPGNRHIIVDWVQTPDAPNSASGLIWEGDAPDNAGTLPPIQLGNTPASELVRVTGFSCGRTKHAYFGIEPCDCKSGGGACQVGQPIRLWDGAVTYTETDPLPTAGGPSPFARSYDSSRAVAGVFGTGWTSLFDAWASRSVVNGYDTVIVRTESGGRSIFRKEGGVWTYLWPTLRTGGATLIEDAAGGLNYRVAGSALVRRYLNGRLVELRNVTDGRATRIDYSQQQNGTIAVTDSRGNWSSTVTLTGGLVTAIAVDGHPELAWTYSYTDGQLQTVSLDGAGTWRTYEYTGARLSAVRDAAGLLIESHAYDSVGRGVTSIGATGDITNVEYPATANSTTTTRVIYATGATDSYEQSFHGGQQATTSVTGGCTSCGARDSVYALDENGRALRQQGADGYITARTYDDAGRVVFEQSYERPSDCDPATDAARCRLTSDALATVALTPTSSTTSVTYAYNDPNWPDKPTRVTMPSVRVASAVVPTDLVYHPGSGAILSKSTTGYTGSPTAQLVTRTTTTAYYGDAGVGSSPAFDPGGAFDPAWLQLPQPPLLPKSIDGPRTDESDITSFVYYPIDSSVPAELRGHLAAVQNAEGHVTRYENYDVFGNVERAVNANGVITVMTYDKLGRVLTSTMQGIAGCDVSADPLCATDLTNTTAYAPQLGRVQSTTRPGSGTTVSTYDDRGRVRTVSRGPVSRSLAEQIEYTYDPATGLKSLERLLAYDSGSWTEKKRESNAYDALQQLQTVTHADGTALHYMYDPAGRLVGTRDEDDASPSVTYRYDPAGRTDRVQQAWSGAAGGTIATSYEYDTAGNLTAVTDPNGNRTTYVYDDFGQMVEQTSPVTGTTRYAFDESGNLISLTDSNNATTVRTYDSLNRVLSARSTSGRASETVSWSYDDTTAETFGIGRLAAMTDPAGSTGYTYERRGLLRSETRVAQGSPQSYITSYAYDADGNRAAIAYPSGATTIQYTYDYAGRPLSATTSGTTLVSAAQYLPFGPPTKLAFGNGTTQTLQYDARYRLTGNALATATSVLAQYAYGYDAVSNITRIDDVTNPGYNRAFSYDELNRLTGTTTGFELWRTSAYTYDAMGNVLFMTQGVENTDPEPMTTARQKSVLKKTTTFEYAGTLPKLQNVTELGATRPVSYDAAGNETHYLVDRTYSPRNLFASMQQADEAGGAPHRLDFSYDGRGLRVARKESPANGPASSATRRYFYTPELRLLASTYDDGASVWEPVLGSSAVAKNFRDEFVWFGDRRIAQIAPATGASAIRYTFADHLGTPLLQTDSTGQVVWRVEYEPFGNVHEVRAGVRNSQPLRFPGQDAVVAWDGGAEENYNIFRWYRSGWGRYTQPDPLGLKGGLGLYTYTENRPTTMVDPLGLVTWTCRVGILLKAGLAIGGGGIVTASCRSHPCIAGKHRLVQLIGIAGGFSYGSPIESSATDIELSDWAATPSASNLSGWFNIESLGLSFLWGYSMETDVTLGNASGKTSGFGWGGFSAGMDALTGYSTVILDSESCCK